MTQVVYVHISGGVAYLRDVPEDTVVEIIDYDIDGTDYPSTCVCYGYARHTHETKNAIRSAAHHIPRREDDDDADTGPSAQHR